MADLRVLDLRTAKYFKILKEISFDKQKSEYMCEDERNIFCSFDDLIKEEYPLKQPASPDAIIHQGDTLYLVEFKNQKPADIDSKNIKAKLEKGKEVLMKLFEECHINKKDYQFFFCVAYQSSQSDWKKHIKESAIQFGLEQYKGALFDEVLTKDIDWFKREYRRAFGTLC